MTFLKLLLPLLEPILRIVEDLLGWWISENSATAKAIEVAKKDGLNAIKNSDRTQLVNSMRRIRRLRDIEKADDRASRNLRD